jgi:hypothetical protein
LGYHCSVSAFDINGIGQCTEVVQQVGFHPILFGLHKSHLVFYLLLLAGIETYPGLVEIGRYLQRVR